MKIKSAILGFCVGVVVSSVCFILADWFYTGIREYDYNTDALTDVWMQYERGAIVSMEEDLNYDGKIDERHTYVDGVITVTEADSDFDGHIDSWVQYSNGVPRVVRVDLDQDQQPDLLEYYQGRQIACQTWVNDAGVVVKRASFMLGVKTKELIDIDEDGHFDRCVTFDLRENPIRTTELTTTVPSGN